MCTRCSASIHVATTTACILSDQSAARLLLAVVPFHCDIDVCSMHNISNTAASATVTTTGHCKILYASIVCIRVAHCLFTLVV
jgi:hypothetical protein